MPHIVRSAVLNAPTDAVWNVLRDFNGYDRWHPAIATSTIERAQASDKIGCVRRLKCPRLSSIPTAWLWRERRAISFCTRGGGQ